MSQMEQCSRCFGRGYIPEPPKQSKRNPQGLGFYARECPGCQGRGERPTVERQPLTCDMKAGCPEPVTHIDRKGFVYCTEHGLERRVYQPCRKLRPAELKQLQRGEPLARY